MPASDFISDYLYILRQKFFADDPKGYFQQVPWLKKSLTELASFLHEKGVSLPERRLREITMEIIRQILAHGQTENIRRFGPYFLQCVQAHVRAKGHLYYLEAKTARNAVEIALTSYTKNTRPAPLPDNSTTEILAELNRLTRIGKGGRKKASCKAPACQLNLI